MRGQPVRTGLALLAFLAFSLSMALMASAEERSVLKGVALVIGQSGYQSLAALPNPKADARAMEERLAELGFKTDLALDEGARKLKRTLAGFVEDSEGADVALVYYSGHAIEVGGINYLIPVDATIQSLDAAEEKLVPLQQMLDELRRKARITILFLDACRTNPFPSATLVRRTATASGEPMSPAGLAATRGAIVLTQDNGPSESLGEILSYAAEPGQVALDGPAGSNSPYAAALLKHLSANTTYDFGQVMTLVTEEVYLATQTRQRPWVNASLRRFLSFGGKVEEASPDDALIKDARRSLLLTIAATPRETRDFVEALATDQTLPLDLVYGMLKELEVDTTGGVERIALQMRDGVEQAKRLRAERDGLRFSDPQIVELSKLAGRAEAEGALALARTYWAKASARADELARNRERDRTDVMSRAREAASVYAGHAEAAILGFDYEVASREYGKAYHEIEWFDTKLAFRYKLAEAYALQDHGYYKGDNDALRRSLTLYSLAIDIAARDHDRSAWAAAQNNLGNALFRLGDRERGTESLRKAIAAYEAALTERTRERTPFDWAATQNNLGNVLHSLGKRESGAATLRKAVTAYEAALTERSRQRVPLDWAMTQNNLGNALQSLGEREGGTETLRKAVAAYEAALTEYPREHWPLDWARAQNNLGLALENIGERESGTETLRKAVAAYEAALTERTRERVPLDWAMTQNNLGNALNSLGAREDSPELLHKAVAAYEAALTERIRERVPLDWARTQSNLGSALRILGDRDGGAPMLRKAVAAYEAALTEHTRERAPLDWAMVQNNLGVALRTLGDREGDTEMLRKAIAAYEAALGEYTRDRVPLDWAMTQSNLGTALADLYDRENDTEILRKAVAAYETALTEYTRERVPLDWARTQNNLGLALQALAGRDGGTEALRKAAVAYEAALTERTREQMPREWAIIQKNLGTVLLRLGERQGGVASLRKAVNALQASVTDNDTWTPAHRAVLQNAIGYGLTIIGERTGDAAHFSEAVLILRGALEETTRMQAPSASPVAASLCRALLGLGRSQKGRSSLLEAKSLCTSTLQSAKEQKMDWVAKETEEILAKTEKALTEID